MFFLHTDRTTVISQTHTPCTFKQNNNQLTSNISHARVCGFVWILRFGWIFLCLQIRYVTIRCLCGLVCILFLFAQASEDQHGHATRHPYIQNALPIILCIYAPPISMCIMHATRFHCALCTFSTHDPLACGHAYSRSFVFQGCSSSVACWRDPFPSHAAAICWQCAAWLSPEASQDGSRYHR